jgi:hypothetical protein
VTEREGELGADFRSGGAGGADSCEDVCYGVGAQPVRELGENIGVDSGRGDDGFSLALRDFGFAR